MTNLQFLENLPVTIRFNTPRCHDELEKRGGALIGNGGVSETRAVCTAQRHGGYRYTPFQLTTNKKTKAARAQKKVLAKGLSDTGVDTRSRYNGVGMTSRDADTCTKKSH